MMKIIVKYYDKIFILLVLLALLLIGLQITDEIDLVSQNAVDENTDWERSSDGVILQPKLKNDIMPGSFIFYKVDDNNFSSV